MKLYNHAEVLKLKDPPRDFVSFVLGRELSVRPASGVLDPFTGIVDECTAALKYTAPHTTQILVSIDEGYPRVRYNGEIEIPNIGNTIAIGTTGRGKTYGFDEVMASYEANGYDVHVLAFGEPGRFLSWNILTYCRVLWHVYERSHSQAQPIVLGVDSLMGVWTDPSLTKFYSIAPSGASYAMLGISRSVDALAVSSGFATFHTLNPGLATVEVIRNGISGATSGFIYLDAGETNMRLYDNLDPNVHQVGYHREQGNFTPWDASSEVFSLLGSEAY